MVEAEIALPLELEPVSRFCIGQGWFNDALVKDQE
jgi:hypothetical protein